MRRISCYLGLCLLFFLSVVQSCFAQSESEKVVADIWNAYESLEFTVAEARISDALAVYDTFLPSQLSEIYIVYALLLYAQSDLDGAERQLRQAVQLWPTTLDPVETPPELLTLFDQIKRENDTAGPSANQAEVRYLLIRDLRAGAALRSMVVPGWGQLYKQERKKGVVLTGLWGITAGGALAAHLNRGQAQRRYNRSTTTEEALDRFGAYSSWHKARNALFLGAVGVWIYSYIDAILLGSPRVNAARSGPPFNISLQPLPGHTEIGVIWQF